MSASIATPPPSTIYSRAVSSPRRTGLRHIRRDECDLVQWECCLPPRVTGFCEKLATSRTPLALDVTAPPGAALLAALAPIAPFTRAETSAAAHWLLEDIAMLAGDFADIAECAEVRVRLERVPDQGCAAFHVDNLPVRLLCTYAGRGMQWAEEEHICRQELGLRGRTIDRTNAAIVPDAVHIRTMLTGAVAIFKGRLWPGGEGRGLIHRSYPVCCADHARLRLVIDPAGHSY